MSDRAAVPTSQLLVYRFGPGAEFEGRLVGALERIENGGAMRVLDALFVSSAPETGELSAVGVRGSGAGGFVATLLGSGSTPLSGGARPTGRSRRARRPSRPRPSAASVRRLGRGCAIAAVLVEHVWAEALDDAVVRTGGAAVARHFVDATALGDRSPQLMAAARAAVSDAPTIG